MKKQCVSCGMLDELQHGVCPDCRAKNTDVDTEVDDTHMVTATFNLQIKLPISVKNLGYTIELILDQMAEHHDADLCSVMDYEYEITGSHNQSKELVTLTAVGA